MIDFTDQIAGVRKRLPAPILLLVMSAAALTMTACGPNRNHRTIIYDQDWSRAAAIRNLTCAPEMRTTCDQRAENMESAFSQKLITAMQASPKCVNVEIIVVRENAYDFKELRKKHSARGFDYWQLRIDFHSGLTRQPFFISGAIPEASSEGEDAERDPGYFCEFAKYNGIIGIG